MKMLLRGAVIAAMAAAALPAWSQTGPTTAAPAAEPAAGLSRNSHAGTPGLPGGKAGPTVTPSGSTMREKHRPSGDQSGISGLPGSKSGPAAVPSNAGK